VAGHPVDGFGHGGGVILEPIEVPADVAFGELAPIVPENPPDQGADILSPVTTLPSDGGIDSAGLSFEIGHQARRFRDDLVRQLGWVVRRRSRWIARQVQ
jgi:hypothetical protein